MILSETKKDAGLGIFFVCLQEAIYPDPYFFVSSLTST